GCIRAPHRHMTVPSESGPHSAASSLRAGVCESVAARLVEHPVKQKTTAHAAMNSLHRIDRHVITPPPVAGRGVQAETRTGRTGGAALPSRPSRSPTDRGTGSTHSLPGVVRG